VSYCNTGRQVGTDKMYRFSLVELNTAHIMKTSTDREFRKALATVRSMSEQQSSSVKNGGNWAKICAKAFDQRIESLLLRCDQSAQWEIQDLRNIVTFVRDAGRPLLCNELLHMLALRQDADESTQIALRSPKEIPEITQGLVDVDHNNVVCFVHPMLKTYLLLDSRWVTIFPSAHFVLAELCLKYLSYDRFPHRPCESESDLASLTIDSPFLSYTAKWWGIHYATAMAKASNEKQETLKTSALDFLRLDASVSCVRQVMAMDDPLYDGAKHTEDHMLVDSPIVNSSPRSIEQRRDALIQCGRTTGIQLAILLKLDGLAEDLERDPSYAVSVDTTQVVRSIDPRVPRTNLPLLRSSEPWSSDSKAAWLALIRPFQQRLDSYKQKAVTNEEEFRSAFLLLCKDYQERDPQRLINRIRKQHLAILDLTKAIDSTLSLEAPAGATALVYRISYTAIWVR
jgi:hypothetical protein